MSAIPAERIRRPELLPLPEDEAKVRAVFEHLTEEGAREFADEIVMATYRSRETGDLRPLVETIDAWYRTLLVMADPESRDRFTEMMAREKSEGHGYTKEEILERKQRRPA